jgi:Rrf2 family protein
MKLITRDTDYALRGICLIAKNNGRVVSVEELVRKLKVPRPFLRKILQSLGREGILKSQRGQGGGFALAKGPKEILVVDLIRIFQGSLRLNECFLRKAACPRIRSCILRKKILKIEDYVRRHLEAITIASLLR